MNDVIHPGYDSAPVIVPVPDYYCTFAWRIRLLQAVLSRTEFAEEALNLRMNSITYSELLDHKAAGTLGEQNNKYLVAFGDSLILRTRELELVAGLINKCSSSHVS